MILMSHGVFCAYSADIPCGMILVLLNVGSVSIASERIPHPAQMDSNLPVISHN